METVADRLRSPSEISDQGDADHAADSVPFFWDGGFLGDDDGGILLVNWSKEPQNIVRG